MLIIADQGKEFVATHVLRARRAVAGNRVFVVLISCTAESTRALLSVLSFFVLTRL